MFTAPGHDLLVQVEPTASDALAWYLRMMQLWGPDFCAFPFKRARSHPTVLLRSDLQRALKGLVMPRAARFRDALGAGYSTRIARERGMLRTVLTDGLAEFTQDPRATMHWTIHRFRTFVFLAYGVKLVGWPRHIKFANLSDASMSSAHIRALLNAWERGRMRWVRATVGELAAAAEDARNACPGPLFQNPHPGGGRNDIGKRRARPTVDSIRYPPRYARDGPKSQRYVDSDDEVEDIEDADNWPGLSNVCAKVARGELAEDPIEPFSDDE